MGDNGMFFSKMLIFVLLYISSAIFVFPTAYIWIPKMWGFISDKIIKFEKLFCQKLKNRISKQNIKPVFAEKGEFAEEK